MPTEPDKKTSWGSVAGVVLGAISVVVGVWITSHLFGQDLAQKQSEIKARAMHRQVFQALERGLETFADQRAESADQEFLQRFARAGDVYRITLYNGKGHAFWSTNIEESQKPLEPGLLTKMAATRAPIVHLRVEKASRIDQLARRMPFGEYDEQAMRNVTVVSAPVMDGGQLTGAVELLLDSTNDVALITRKKTLAMVSIGGFLAIILLIAGYLINRYERARNDFNAATAVAHKARKSAAEAREKADEFADNNEFVGQLNRLLEVNLKQLNEAQDELVRKSRLAQMGQLTATVAHEIRNPLSALHNALFIIRKLSTDSGPIKRHLDLAHRSINRCNTIITELLDFTSGDKLRREKLNFDDWVLTTIKEQAQHLPAMVSVVSELSARDLEASFDPERLRRVLMHMLANASEAMVGKDGDPIDVVAHNPQIKILTHETSRGIELKVTDNGPGMDQRQLSKIFEPLYSTKNFGVGLGVPAMQQILQQHGGGLEYESEAGKGTTATAWFPLDFTETAPVTQTSVPEKFRAPNAAKSA